MQENKEKAAHIFTAEAKLKWKDVYISWESLNFDSRQQIIKNNLLTSNVLNFSNSWIVLKSTARIAQKLSLAILIIFFYRREIYFYFRVYEFLDMYSHVFKNVSFNGNTDLFYRFGKNGSICASPVITDKELI